MDKPLSSVEMRWVDNINNGKYSTIKDFIYDNISSEIVNIYGKTDLRIVFPDSHPFGPKWQQITFTHEAKKVLGINENPIVISKSLQFVRLLRKLEENGYITRVAWNDFDPREFPYYKSDGASLVLNDLAEIFKQFTVWRIHKNPSLSTYVHAGYMTESEAASRRVEDRIKRAESRSLWVSILVPLIGITIQLGLAYFQYKTYDKERVVIIKNPESFGDSLVVKIDGKSIDSVAAVLNRALVHRQQVTNDHKPINKN